MSVDVVVINLTRFGDLLQTQSLIDDLSLGNKKVGLVCLENFAPAAELMRNITKVWALPGSSLMAAVDAAWPMALERVWTFAAEIRSAGAPVLNLTPTLPARLLARLLAGEDGEILGFGLDGDGYGKNTGLWASFIAVAARKRLNAPFNLSDMLRRLALPLSGNLDGSHRLAEPGEESLQWARNFLEGQKIPGCAGYVGFQPGASEERRRWPAAYFRELGKLLWDRHRLVPILFGSPGEMALAKKIMNGFPVINAAGATTLPRLAALLSRCRLLVTNDTGTMHLASGLGIPGIAFFLATAQPQDTGPLMPGWCCLEPSLACHPCAFGSKCANDEACRSRISAGTVFNLASNWLETGKWSGTGSECRIWETGRDEAQFAVTIPLSGQETSSRSFWTGFMRAFWINLLDGLDFSGKAASCPLPSLPKGSPEAEACGQAAALLESMEELCGLAKTSRKGGELLLKNCERVQAIFDRQPNLAPIASFWAEFRQNQGEDLQLFAKFAIRLAKILRHLEQS